MGLDGFDCLYLGLDLGLDCKDLRLDLDLENSDLVPSLSFTAKCQKLLLFSVTFILEVYTTVSPEPDVGFVIEDTIHLRLCLLRLETKAKAKHLVFNV